MFIAGIDIGNSTTETALCRFENGRPAEFFSGIAPTTGIKSTPDNIRGIRESLEDACAKAGILMNQIDLMRINEATPVIGDFAMETVTETIITESTMIGHNPDTPGGEGYGEGLTVKLEELEDCLCRGDGKNESYIVVIDRDCDFQKAARTINRLAAEDADIRGAIVQKDDAVLIVNRLEKMIPVVDEVREIQKVPLGCHAAVEVAGKGRCISRLADPYGIATAFGLTPEETDRIVHVANALIGNRSAVVIRTPGGSVKKRTIPAGIVTVEGERGNYSADINDGADVIMEKAGRAGEISDVSGSSGSNVGGMLAAIKQKMAQLTGDQEVFIRDIWAVDTIVPQKITGGIADEFFMEKSLGLAAMVKSGRMHMKAIADRLSEETGVPVEVGGAEGDMAALGTLTTPGTGKPILVVDIGAGSTDACWLDDKESRHLHFAGAGDMVTALINVELGLDDPDTAERIKRYPLAKVTSMYSVRYEDGSVDFFEEPLDSSIFAKAVSVTPEGFVPVDTKHSPEKIAACRRSIKEKVIVKNVLRLLGSLAETGNINSFSHVVLVGGSALDFEIPGMLTETLLRYGITCGKGNIRGTEGPRNAVATGLVLSYAAQEAANGI